MVDLIDVIPARWHDRLDGYAIVGDGEGWSDAEIFRLEKPGASALFLKREAVGRFAELPAEGERLRWLAAQNVPVPEVIGTADTDRFHHLLMRALPGADLDHADLAPDRKVTLAAMALRRLHALPVADCPFDRRLGTTVALAAARFEAGLVDESDFDDENRDLGGAALLAKLKVLRPSDEDLVVAHGDAGFGNLMVDRNEFAGFIDVGRLGVADRALDLSIMARDIEADCGRDWLPAFFAAYGLGTPNAGRMAYYRLLDEFF